MKKTAAIALIVALALFTGASALASPESNHCITPAGTDANEVLGVTEQLVIPDAPREAGCGPVSAGESWIPLAGAYWVANTSFESVPAGYEPSAATPIEDFLSKAETITYVIDAGTAREKAYRSRVQDVVKVDTVDEFFSFDWPEPYPIAQFLAKLPPLPPGEHTYTAVLHMSERSCDGLGAEAFNCIGPGETVLCTLRFTVEPRTGVRPS